MNIIDIMTTEVIKVGATTRLSTAVELMQKYQVRHLLVIEGDGSLIGIVSDRDLRLAVQSPYAVYDTKRADLFAETILVKQVMTKTPYCSSPQSSLAEAASLMVEHHISALPVLQDGDIVGIVTSTDLLKVLVSQPV